MLQTENSIPLFFIIMPIQYFLLSANLSLAHIPNKINRTKILSDFVFHIFVAMGSFTKSFRIYSYYFSLPIQTAHTTHTDSADCHPHNICVHVLYYVIFSSSRARDTNSRHKYVKKLLNFCSPEKQKKVIYSVRVN